MRMAPAAGVLGIVGLDAVAAFRPWSVLATGLLDEPAHLLTAWLVVRALPVRAAPPWLCRWALVGSVAIDLDHLPLYLGNPGFLVDDSRPPTHSLALVVLLLAVALLRPLRRPAAGLAVGVLLHFVRDVATGPGVPLWWPMDDAVLRVPYPLYLAVLGVAAVIATLRWDGARRVLPGPSVARLS
jgi:inner membrane protein